MQRRGVRVNTGIEREGGNKEVREKYSSHLLGEYSLVGTTEAIGKLFPAIAP